MSANEKNKCKPGLKTSSSEQVQAVLPFPTREKTDATQAGLWGTAGQREERRKQLDVKGHCQSLKRWSGNSD